MDKEKPYRAQPLKHKCPRGDGGMINYFLMEDVLRDRRNADEAFRVLESKLSKQRADNEDALAHIEDMQKRMRELRGWLIENEMEEDHFAEKTEPPIMIEKMMKVRRMLEKYDEKIGAAENSTYGNPLREERDEALSRAEATEKKLDKLEKKVEK